MKTLPGKDVDLVEVYVGSLEHGCIRKEVLEVPAHVKEDRFSGLDEIYPKTL